MQNADLSTLCNALIISAVQVKSAECRQNDKKLSRAGFSKLLLSVETILILKLTDRTDCTDSFAHATCFSTTEMTDFTDFVSIACSLRYWPVTYPWRNTLVQIM